MNGEARRAWLLAEAAHERQCARAMRAWASEYLDAADAHKLASLLASAAAHAARAVALENRARKGTA